VIELPLSSSVSEGRILIVECAIREMGTTPKILVSERRTLEITKSTIREVIPRCGVVEFTPSGFRLGN